MARVFAVMAQILLRAGVIAVQTLMEPGFSHGTECEPKALVQYRGTNLIGAGIESGYRRLSGGRCAYPGLSLKANLSGQPKLSR